MLVVLNLKKITKCKCSLLEAIYKKAVFRNFRKPTEKKQLQRRTALPKTYSILGFFDRNFRSFLEQICYNSTPVKSYCQKMFLYFKPFNSFMTEVPIMQKSVHLLCKSMDWLLYGRELRRERLKSMFRFYSSSK